MDNFLHRGEVSGPQKLGLLAQGEDPRREHFTEGSQDLQWESLISNDGCLGPVDDFRERQLPAGAEEHGDAAGLKGLEKAGGGRSVTRDEAEGGIGKGLSWVGLLGSRVLLTVPVPEAG